VVSSGPADDRLVVGRWAGTLRLIQGPALEEPKGGSVALPD
jgi:hypothetical protein